MIDFKTGLIFKLKPCDENKMNKAVNDFIIDGEEILNVFQTVRDQVVFTNKRVIAINVQGITGKKTDFTSIPYSKVQTFSVETAGTFDRDCEIDLFISSIGKIHFEIKGDFDIVKFNKTISKYVL